MSKKIFFCLMAGSILSGITSNAMALISNADFETGDLSGYFVQEDGVTVGDSPLVNIVDDGYENFVVELRT